MTLLTSVPGDIPALLLNGSPVCLHDRSGYVVLGASPDDNVRLACIRSGRNEPHYVGFVALDLTDATGRWQAARWILAHPDGIILLRMDQRIYRLWRSATYGESFDAVQIDTLARLVLRLAGRTP